MVVKGSIEDKMLMLQQQKKALYAAMDGTPAAAASLHNEMMASLFENPWMKGSQKRKAKRQRTS